MRLINKLFKKFREIYAVFYSKFIFDKEKVKQKESFKFSKLGIDENKSEKHLNKILNKKIGRNYNPAIDSVHWKLFSGISLLKKDIKEILEIGTYDGFFTKILSELFPDAKITSIDLPLNDPLMKNFYGRNDDALINKFIKIQKSNTKSKNINVIKTNSFFFNSKIESNTKYDLIWVDGGHLYPEIAWDLCNAYNRLNSNGLMCCDDIIRTDENFKTKYVSNESWKVLNYLDERIDNKNIYFLKRSNGKSYCYKFSRKYVSCLLK